MLLNRIQEIFLHFSNANIHFAGLKFIVFDYPLHIGRNSPNPGFITTSFMMHTFRYSSCAKTKRKEEKKNEK